MPTCPSEQTICWVLAHSVLKTFCLIISVFTVILFWQYNHFSNTTCYLVGGKFEDMNLVKHNFKFIRKTREKPQGVGVIFLLASSEIPEKKPHPPGAFREQPLYTPV